MIKEVLKEVKECINTGQGKLYACDYKIKNFNQDVLFQQENREISFRCPSDKIMIGGYPISIINLKIYHNFSHFNKNTFFSFVDNGCLFVWAGDKHKKRKIYIDLENSIYIFKYRFKHDFSYIVSCSGFSNYLIHTKYRRNI